MRPEGRVRTAGWQGPLVCRAMAPKNPAGGSIEREFSTCVLQTWQRPTLPRLETKYHQRWSVSRPSSEWDRVQPLRHDHQVNETHAKNREAVVLSCRGKRRACRHRWTRWAQIMRTIKPIERLVPVSFMRCRTSTPGLSTWSSTTTLREYSFPGGFPA